ncbi:MAG: serine hydrolase [Bacteroidota bacterium]
MILICKSVISQTVFSFDSILNSKPLLKQVAENYKKYRLQIIYTQIKRDAAGKPTFKNYVFHVDSTNYFYCASLVKLPCSIVALEKINELKLNKDDIMFTDSANACQHSVKTDTSSVNGYPSVAQYIKRMFLVSDNFAYGRVYEFLGVDYLHDRLSELGYKNMRIVHRFDGGCKGDGNLITNPVSFYNKEMKLLYQQKQGLPMRSYANAIGTFKVGRAYYNAQNKKVNEPKDFTHMNYISLQNIHGLLQRLVFNDFYPAVQQYHLTKNDRDFLIQYLTLLPRESSHPSYNKSFYDSYKKYFMYGDSKQPITDKDLKITNIVGQSYGFMVDCAYIHNDKLKVEFMLSAAIYANEDEIINDGKYEYNALALPFLAELGRQIYKYELNKK